MTFQLIRTLFVARNATSMVTVVWEEDGHLYAVRRALVGDRDHIMRDHIATRRFFEWSEIPLPKQYRQK